MKYRQSRKRYHIDFYGTPAELGKLSNKIGKLEIQHTIKATQLKKFIRVTISIKFEADGQKIREFLRSVE